MVIDILKTVAVGVCAAIPPGPILVLVLGKCMQKGRNSGLLTALGSVTVDMLYTTIALFALGYFQRFMDSFEKEVMLGGGIVLVAVGALMALKACRKSSRPINESAGPGDYFQALGMGFSNLGAVAMIFALLAIFGVADGTPRDWHMLPFIAAEAAGEILYWSLLTYYAAKLKGRISVERMSIVNVLMGVAIAVFGVVMTVKGIVMYVV
ncbi:MAG: LysE family translocator [Bacteroidales bacterium]|nr:LysE family translocator [Bacteroidales bacterium]